jgi:hypothetical protein
MPAAASRADSLVIPHLRRRRPPRENLHERCEIAGAGIDHRGVACALLNPAGMNASRLHVVSPGKYQLALSGRFPSGWAGTFTQALSHSGFNIESGFAARNQRGHWAAEFELSAGPDIDPFRVDFDALVVAPSILATPAALRLHRYSLARPAGDSRVGLSVQAPDHIGFLAALLTPLAMFSLFPVEMKIDTVRGMAHDRFHLRSTAGGAPSDAGLQNVRDWLDSCLRPAAAAGTAVAVNSR